VIRRLLVVLVISGLLAGCAELPNDIRLGPYPSCDVTWHPPAPSSRGRLLLIAQSVPNASMIPCLGELPPGWDFTGVSVRTSQTRLTVVTDTFDLEVQILLVGTCDIAGATQVPSNAPGARLYLAEDGRTLTYVFEGGCVLVEFPTAALAASSEGRALTGEIHLMTRDELRALSGWDL